MARRGPVKVGIITIFIQLLVFLSLGTAGASGYGSITAEELKPLLDRGEKVLLVNALSPIEFDGGETIAGSINIPSSMVSADNSLLPAAKDDLIVTFCLGPRCSKRLVAAEALVKLGYTNVKEYAGGIPEWSRLGYPMDPPRVPLPDYQPERLAPKDLQARLGSVTVLDIRDSEHLVLGVIKDAVQIRMDDIREGYKNLPSDKMVVVVCHVGNQSPTAARFLKMHGYETAIMDGGMMAWMRDRLPVEK